MILCEDFVFVHYPKTGGTFVADVLKRALASQGKAYREADMHATCRDIPAEYRSLPILSCVRNPFDLKVSQYMYEWWKHDAPQNVKDALKKAYPSFPNLAFAEYVDGWDRAVNVAVAHAEINPFARSLGQYTHKFITFFFRDPDATVGQLDDGLIRDTARLSALMFDVHFLKTDSLNQGLYGFLRGVGYPEDRLRFILDEDKILPPGGKRRRRRHRWQAFYTPPLVKLVSERERLLFTLFPEFCAPAGRECLRARIWKWLP